MSGQLYVITFSKKEYLRGEVDDYLQDNGYGEYDYTISDSKKGKAWKVRFGPKLTENTSFRIQNMPKGIKFISFQERDVEANVSKNLHMKTTITGSAESDEALAKKIVAKLVAGRKKKGGR
jgi:hypothetical protein